jgi:23S rRNA (uridine2552-2'-O)-methyltransferase
MAGYEKQDHWSLKAQKEGYPARSVYKLKEMDERFGLLRPHAGGPLRVLDLGAAPGSWSLYVLRTMGPGVTLVAADLSPLSRRDDRGLFDGKNLCFIQGDITAEDVRAAILAQAPFDLVLCDAAPATTGNRSVDTLRSLALAEEAFAYAEAALAKGGGLVVKVFQGGDTQALLRRLRSSFQTAKSYKPEACRSQSFETYYLGLGRR